MLYFFFFSGVLDDSFQEKMDDSLQILVDDSDDDLDINMDDLGAIPDVTPRNAAIEPATDVDLTAFESEVMAVEEASNDAAIRQMASEDSFDFHWTKDAGTFTGQRETFTGPTPGPTFPFTTIVDVFMKMFDTDFIDRLCTETNRYARNKIQKLTQQGKLTEISRLRRWTDTYRD